MRNKLEKTYKVIDVEIDADTHPQEADRIRDLLDRLRTLSDLDEQVKQCDSYDNLLENVDAVREYETVYGLVQSIWNNDSLKKYATRRAHPPMFNIEMFPHGFYCIPRLYHGTACSILGDYLKKRDVGVFSLVWRGFIVEPDQFSKAHDLLEPFYYTPGDVE